MTQFSGYFGGDGPCPLNGEPLFLFTKAAQIFGSLIFGYTMVLGSPERHEMYLSIVHGQRG